MGGEEEGGLAGTLIGGSTAGPAQSGRGNKGEERKDQHHLPGQGEWAGEMSVRVEQGSQLPPLPHPAYQLRMNGSCTLPSIT